MSHVVRYRDDDGELIEDATSLEEALARLQELHQAGNSSGRIYREVPVRVQTVVHVSVDDPTGEPVESKPAQASPEPAAPAPEAPEAAASEAEAVVEAQSDVEADEPTVADVAAEHALDADAAATDTEDALAPVELPPLPAFFDEPDDAAPPPPAPRRAVAAVDFVARSG